MSGFNLQSLAYSPLGLDLRGITPAALAGLSADEVARLRITHGNAWCALGEFFHVTPRADERLVLHGDLRHCHHVGWQMEGGEMVAEGEVGRYAGGGMRGGSLVIRGHAGALAACEMAGGQLTIHGDCGDFAASTLPGSADGMRGGTLLVHGKAGARFADRMRRGTAMVLGDAGDFFASRLVAGTVVLGGRAGAHLGYGMRRGSVLCVQGDAAGGDGQPPSPTFVPAGADAPVFWQLLARDLARQLATAGTGWAAQLPQRRIARWLGDIGSGGQGEVITLV